MYFWEHVYQMTQEDSPLIAFFDGSTTPENGALACIMGLAIQKNFSDNNMPAIGP